MARTWTYLTALLLIPGWMTFNAHAQPGTSGIQTRELAPPPGMGGPVDTSATADRNITSPTTGKSESNALQQDTTNTQRSSRDTRNREGNRPVSGGTDVPLTTELRQEEQQVSETGTTTPPVTTENKEKKTTAPSPRPKQPVAAFWLVLPQDQPRR